MQGLARPVPVLRYVQPPAQSSFAGAAKDVVAAAAGAPVHGGRVDDGHGVGVVPVRGLLVAEEREPRPLVQYFALVRTGDFGTSGTPPTGIFGWCVFSTYSVII